MLEVANDEAHDYGPIDSIPYKGGPISQKDYSAFRRQHFTDGHKLALHKKRTAMMTQTQTILMMNLKLDLTLSDNVLILRIKRYQKLLAMT